MSSLAPSEPESPFCRLLTTNCTAGRRILEEFDLHFWPESGPIPHHRSREVGLWEAFLEAARREGRWMAAPGIGD
jgi:hypothetical protein